MKSATRLRTMAMTQLSTFTHKEADREIICKLVSHIGKATLTAPMLNITNPEGRPLVTAGVSSIAHIAAIVHRSDSVAAVCVC